MHTILQLQADLPSSIAKDFVQLGSSTGLSKPVAGTIHVDVSTLDELRLKSWTPIFEPEIFSVENGKRKLKQKY